MRGSIWNTLMKDSAIYGGADFLSKVLSFMFFPLIARYISVVEFGAMELIFTVIGLLGVVVNIGLNNAVQRFYWDKDTLESARPVIVSSALLVQVLSGVVVTVLAGALVLLYGVSFGWQGQPFDGRVLLYALVFMAASQWIQFALDVVRLHFKPWRFFALSILFRVCGLLLAAWLVIEVGARLDGILGAQALVAVLVLPLALMLISKDLVLSFSRAWIKALVSYGYPYIFAAFAYWIFGAIDRWMLASMSSVEEVGVYSVAFRFSSIVLFVSMAFGQAWSPVAMKIRTENPERYRRIFANVLLILFMVMALVGGSISLFAGEGIGLLLPAEYHDSAIVLIPLCLGVVLQATQQVTAVGISIERKSHLIAKISWCAVVVNVLLNLWLIPSFGAQGAAWATAVTYLFITATYLAFTQHLHPLEVSWSRLIAGSIGVVALFCVAIVTCQTELQFSVIMLKLFALAVFCGVGAFVLPLKKVLS